MQLTSQNLVKTLQSSKCINIRSSDMMKGQSGLEKWEILKFQLFSHFSHFWLSQANQKAVEAHLWDSGPSRWYLSLVRRTISSFKKNIMVLRLRRSWGPRLPWKYLSEKNYFFSKIFWALGHHRQWKFLKKKYCFRTGIFRPALDLRNALNAKP